jgi:hypothetical protein
VVVFDRATVLNTRFEKNWRMPLAGQPQFANGTSAPGPSRGPDGTARRTHSTNTTLLTATNRLYGADSKLWFTPMLPASRDVVVGQAPQEARGFFVFEDPYGRSAIDGQTPMNHEATAAPWRIEVVSATGNLTDVFLNVIEVGDSGAAQSPTEQIRGDRFAGARIGNRIAVFGASSDRETNGSFVVPTAGAYRILIAGLQPGAEFDVTVGGATQRVSAGATGTLYLDQAVAANTTVTLRGTGVVAPLPPAPPQNVRIVPAP